MANNDEKLVFPIGISTFDQADFEKKWGDYQKKIQAIIDKSKFSFKVDIDTESIRQTLAALNQIKDMQAQMANPKSTPAAMLKAKLMAEGKATAAATVAEAKANAILANSATQATAAQERLARSKIQTEMASRRLTASINSQTTAHSRQIGVLSQIPQMVKSYVSLLAGFRVAQNIKDVTAEFEMQRVALAAIIQDKPKADALFGQVVELGLQSPFQIKDLITFTKQLAAYRVETESLFETTSRLADISAGLGVDMSRLILAYGQVKAASVLRGQELRQFTEAGIPMVDLLAKKFSDLKDEVVTTGDVFDMMRKRLIPFSIVKELFEDMTNAGGVFYNMQMIQAQTLKGVWSNLRDAYDKMFMQMGNSQMGLLKGIPNTLKAMANNWEVIVDLVAKGAVAYGAYRLAVLANTAAQGKELKSFLATTMAAKQKEATLLRQAAAYRTLTGAEAAKIWTSNRLTRADIAQAISSNKITAEMALRMIVLKRLTAAQITQIVNSDIITRKQAIEAASTNRLKFAYISATASLRTFALSVKASTVALLSNPYTLAIAAIAGIGSIMSKVFARNNDFKQLTKDIATQSRTYAEEIKEAYKGISQTMSEGLSAGADEGTTRKAVSALQAIIEKNESLKPIVDARLKGIESEIEKLGILKRLYEDIKNAASTGEEDSGAISGALKGTGSVIFNKDFLENTTKLGSIIDKVSNELQLMRRNGVEGAIDIQNQFALATKYFRNGSMGVEDYAAEISRLAGVSEKFSDDAKRQGKADNWVYFSAAIRKAGKSLNATQKDADDFFETFKAGIADTINGERIDWTKDGLGERFGLTKTAFEALQVKLTVAKEMWFRTMTDIQKGVVSGMWGREFQTPFLNGAPDVAKLSDYEKAYNDMVGRINSKYKGIPLVSEIEPTTEERDLSELAKSKLEELVDTQKKYTNEVAAGNKENEKKLPILNKEVEVWKSIAAWTGNDPEKADKKTNPAIAALSKDVQLVEEAYKKFKELEKQIGKTAAQTKVEQVYGGQGNLPLVFTASGMTAMYARSKELFGKMGKDATGEMFKAMLNESDSQFDDLTENFKMNMDAMSKKISQTQQANDFYEKMLGITGNEKLSKEIALKVTGFETGDMAKQLQDQFTSAAKQLKVEIPLNADQISISGSRAAIQSSDIGEGNKKFLEDLLKSYVDYQEKSMTELFSGLDKFQSYEDKKTEILVNGEMLRKKAIETGQTQLIESINNMTEKKLADLEYENLKTTDMYMDMFGDLDNLSTDALEKIKNKLVEMSKASLKGLSPTNAKDLIGKIEELNKKIIERNPFKTWVESLKEIKSLQATISNLEGTISAGKAAGLSPVLLETMIGLMDELKKKLNATQNQGNKAWGGMVKDISEVYTAAQDVASGVRDIFEEFGIGEDTIAGKSLSLIETIGSGVMKVLQTTAAVAAAGITAAEKASVILTIISVVLQVAMKIYQLFSKETNLARQIEALTKDVEYLQEVYDKLVLKSISDPGQLNRLREELDIRKEMLEVTKRQIEAEIPGGKDSSREYLMRALGLQMTFDKKKPFDFNAAGLTGGFNYWVRLLVEQGKLKKYNEYITEANERLKYQGELYKILNSDMNNIAKTAKARVENLKEQNRLLKLQVDAEMALGRKMDVSKLLELQQKIARNEVDMAYAYLDTVNEVIGDVFTEMNDSITDVLQSAWESGEDGALAYEETVRKVMQNVVTSLWKTNVLSALMQPAMAELYKSMGLTADGKVAPGTTPDFNIDSKEMKSIMAAWAAAEGGILSSWEGVQKILDAMGTGAGEDLTGIAKGYATASEESILTLSSYANSQLYYLVAQYNIQQRILEIMEASRGTQSPSDSSGVMTNLYNVQSQALLQLKDIAAYTSRSAVGIESIVDAINKMSMSGGKYINVNQIN